MKQSELSLSVFTVPLDFLTLVMAACAAYFLRSVPFVTAIRPIEFNLPFEEFITLVFWIAPFWILVFAIAGLYTIGSRRLMSEVSKIFLACSTGILSVIVVLFFTRELFSSRFIVLATWGFTFLFVSLERVIVRAIQRQFFKQGKGVTKIVLVGNDDNTRIFKNTITKNPGLGYQVVEQISEVNDQSLSKLNELLKSGGIEQVIQLDPNFTRDKSKKLYEITTVNHVTFKYVADMLATNVKNLGVETIAGIPIIEIKRTRLEGWGKVFKRIFDIVISCLLIIVALPVMASIGILVILTSRGPMFFKYQRVGRAGKEFNFLKFRSMVHGSHNLRYDEKFRTENKDERAGTPVVKFRNDPRVTPFGKFIRRWSLDELPQLFLSLWGSMSLIGPRPHEKEEVAQYKKHHLKVLTLKPGITGLAQISGRSDLDFEEEVKLDSYYIENWSPWLDLQILLRTPLAVIRNRKTD
ncbi:MAG: hypothetical protein COT81_00920 [Candidatus Buchananbacteria bacterium CG10_big_fil_rev_8_21_14_0_10_42_9]|uniref:Bacterial sugar transferase domain-containing protein n=1 Tax=Candidatus Buchananbacteria bacterium CG10_big_fil_rev_8_21_14_0_10_42_9 TaxID=1974526 RepID=A0A2H0W247_9BACT|nr:MAG: hypothetical protein COT81_00920 [Candidatus Buchananbacteria bacterium CG10_big_fil_rev_8_21_14_0_10_42_9]